MLDVARKSPLVRSWANRVPLWSPLDSSDDLGKRAVANLGRGRRAPCSPVLRRQRRTLRASRTSGRRNLQASAARSRRYVAREAKPSRDDV